MSTDDFYDAHGTHLSVYATESEVVMNLRPTGSDVPGADHCMTTMYARGIGRRLIEHADAIDKAAHDKHAAEVLERRNQATQRYLSADWTDLASRATRTMIDRIIELETQQEENK